MGNIGGTPDFGLRDPENRVPKKCTFLRVFNNSPSRDRCWVFFGFFRVGTDPPLLGGPARVPPQYPLGSEAGRGLIFRTRDTPRTIPTLCGYGCGRFASSPPPPHGWLRGLLHLQQCSDNNSMGTTEAADRGSRRPSEEALWRTNTPYTLWAKQDSSRCATDLRTALAKRKRGNGGPLLLNRYYRGRGNASREWGARA